MIWTGLESCGSVRPAKLAKSVLPLAPHQHLHTGFPVLVLLKGMARSRPAIASIREEHEEDSAVNRQRVCLSFESSDADIVPILGRLV